VDLEKARIAVLLADFGGKDCSEAAGHVHSSSS
jgi:hypothetical protein